MVVPIGFILGHLFACPILLAAKLSFQSDEATGLVPQSNLKMDGSLHVYDSLDLLILGTIAIGIFF
jgi:hypothetical protein